MPSAQDTASSLVPQELVAPPNGLVRLLIDSVQHEEMLLDRLTLAIRDGSDTAAVVSIARELVERRTRGSNVAAANAELPD